MDPYLEHPAYWSGFHARMIVNLSTAITELLPPTYFAEVEQHVWLAGEDPSDREPFAIPDGFVGMFDGGHNHGDRENGAVATLAATEPDVEVTMAQLSRKRGTKYITIVDQPCNRVVTVIELLSPSNKTRGEDREAYLAIRNEYLTTRTNLVEIDLLRDGQRMPIGKPKPPAADYYAIVCRENRYPKASVWSFTVRDPLPVLPIPLKPADGDIVLNLGACLTRTYDEAGYVRRIDYSKPPDIPLSKSDAVWATDLFKKPKKTTKK
jgi:hypothetical protein